MINTSSSFALFPKSQQVCNKCFKLKFEFFGLSLIIFNGESPLAYGICHSCIFIGKSPLEFQSNYVINTCSSFVLFPKIIWCLKFKFNFFLLFLIIFIGKSTLAYGILCISCICAIFSPFLSELNYYYSFILQIWCLLLL